MIFKLVRLIVFVSIFLIGAFVVVSSPYKYEYDVTIKQIDDDALIAIKLFTIPWIFLLLILVFIHRKMKIYMYLYTLSLIFFIVYLVYLFNI